MEHGLVQEEFEISEDYSIKTGNTREFSFLVPLPEGKSEKQLVVFRADSSGAPWELVKTKEKISIGKTKAVAVPVKIGRAHV